MSGFVPLIDAVHDEVWQSDADATPRLAELLSALSEVPLPPGVVRLPTALMAAGPHLGAQGTGAGGADACLAARRAEGLRRGRRPT